MQINKIQIKKSDIIKFFIYFIMFFSLLFAYNNAQSPFTEVQYNSASIYSKEEIKNNNEQPFQIGQKLEIKPTLTINFRPENIKIDNKMIEILKLNINSNFFKKKITPLNLLIDGERLDPRGQISGNKLILSSKISSYNETMKVFVHELGHIIDIYYLKNKNNYDLSDKFYKISWIDYNIKKKDAKIFDFVTGYSLASKYEDFAESFAFFVFHNEEFKKLSKNNIFIQDKYIFFKDYIFSNNEFINTSFLSGSLRSYNWDSTKIPINLKKYLYYIR